MSVGRRRFSATYQLVFRLIKALIFLTFITVLILLIALPHMTFKDIIVCILAFMPTGWGLLLVSYIFFVPLTFLLSCQYKYTIKFLTHKYISSSSTTDKYMHILPSVVPTTLVSVYLSPHLWVCVYFVYVFFCGSRIIVNRLGRAMFPYKVLGHYPKVTKKIWIESLIWNN